VLDQWTGCMDGAEVALYTVNGGGHNWPGGIDAALANPQYAAFVGVTTQEIDAGELMWEHFSR
jgi:polyhydroxybutyrate depolymerase